MTWLRIVVAAALLLVAARSDAEDRGLARDHYKRAMLHYKLAEYQKALDEFKEAFRNYEEPSMLFNIAQCHRQLGQRADAIRFYRAYLRDVPGSANRAEVERTIEKLDAEERADAIARAAAAQPKTTTTAPPATTNLVVATPPTKKPVYKQWWLWTGVGAGVVALGLGLGLGLGLPRAPSAKTQGGTFDPFQ